MEVQGETVSENQKLYSQQFRIERIEPPEQKIAAARCDAVIVGGGYIAVMADGRLALNQAGY
jgi:NADPH-dependent 2,4-dienoyl-CoA reductase/sulfur reductase-like enzyme